MNEKLTLTQEWDKTFPKSGKVDHSKVTFRNRYGITLAADLYVPKGASGKLPAIAVCGPFGAVKEQSSGLYGQTMAERGFLRLLSTPPSPARAAALPAIWPPRTSTRRTSRRRWTTSPCGMMWTRKRSVLSASAAGAAWR